jgi:hypothetical protein
VVFLDAAGRLRGAAVFVPDGRTPPAPLYAGREAVDRWAGYLDENWIGRVRPYVETEGAAGRERARLRVPRAPLLLPAASGAQAVRSAEPRSGTPEDPDS